jgi:hypothetical protein
MVKICQTRLLKLKFETRPKKRIFRFLPKTPQAMDEVENFFLPISKPWALRVSGMGGYTSKCEKSQNHCTLLQRFWQWWAKLLRLLTVNSLSYFVKIKY